MIRLVGCLAALALVSACAPAPDAAPVPERPIGMPNPASAACVNAGGTLTIVDRPGGQVGICRLRDGRQCEEWALFRDGRCVPG